MSQAWLSEEQFERLWPLLPTKVRGVGRVDDWRVSGNIHVVSWASVSAASLVGQHGGVWAEMVEQHIGDLAVARLSCRQVEPDRS